MKRFSQGGYSFFKVLVILTVAALILIVGIPSIKTLAGQTGENACKNNIETISRLEDEYYSMMGTHTKEYTNLDYVDEDSTLFVAGFLSEDDINCRQTGGQYKWQEVNGRVILVCTGHND